MNAVTSIRSAIEAGDPQAAAHLLPLVYDELRKLAAARLADLEGCRLGAQSRVYLGS